MNITITNVSMSYNGGKVDKVKVHFQGKDEERTINVNGYIPLTAEQYTGNEAPSALQDIVRQEVSNRIMDDGSAE